MTWKDAAGLCAGALTAINLINLFLNNRLRADMAELKLSIAEARAKDRDDLKEWASEEFQPAAVAEARFETLRAQIAAIR
jgi:hypothetical protein